MTCCPSCGFNIVADSTIERDGWLIETSGRVSFEGRVISMTATHAEIIRTVASSDRTVTRNALMNRVSYSDDVGVLAVQVCRLRKLLREQGIPMPLETVHGRGYRWAGPQSFNDTRRRLPDADGFQRASDFVLSHAHEVTQP